jgi:hypothetical protein
MMNRDHAEPHTRTHKALVTSSNTPALSYTMTQPTRQPGTRNSLAMPPTDNTGTVVVSDASG